MVPNHGPKHPMSQTETVRPKGPKRWSQTWSQTMVPNGSPKHVPKQQLLPWSTRWSQTAGPKHPFVPNSPRPTSQTPGPKRWVPNTQVPNVAFGTMGVGTTVWDHGCSCLGSWVFGTTVWDQCMFGNQLFGTIVWTMGPAVVWDHRLARYVFGTHRFRYHGLLGAHNLGPCVFGTMVWDHGCSGHAIWVWDQNLGPLFGTMQVLAHCLGPGVWDHVSATVGDHGRLGRTTIRVWDRKQFGDHGLGPDLSGDPAFVWDYGCLGPAVWDQLSGTSCWDPPPYVFGTSCVGPFKTIVWDHRFGPLFGSFVWDHVWDHGCPWFGTIVWDLGV